MIVLKNGHVFDPTDQGKQTILIGGEEIIDMQTGDYSGLTNAEEVDLDGKYVFPGFVDPHTHITGGGGEGGFASRAPQTQLSHFIKAGITTTVGLLGTDAMTRNMESVVAKAKALKEEGMTAYALTGSYSYPTPTLFDSIEKDITFIEEIIGAKIAANDHRDSTVTAEELIKIGTQARRAGMISGKSGHVTVHMGEGKFGFDQIYQALERSNIPLTTFRPTHVNRSEELIHQSLDFAKKGGLIDITVEPAIGAVSNTEFFQIAEEKDVPFSQITCSTDGFGSWSDYDEAGNLVKMGVISINTLRETLQQLVKDGFALEKVLPLFTSNAADTLLLKKKGHVKAGYDADILIFSEDLELEGVIARGQWMMRDKELVKTGLFE